MHANQRGPQAQIMVSWLSCVALGACLAMLALHAAVSPAYAEILPTSGTFEGVYRRDRWGVGQFAFYSVAPDLHKKLKPYEGKRISLEVKKATQRMNPGPGVIEKIGAIKLLVDLPLAIELATMAGRLDHRGGPEIEVACFLHNQGQDTVSLSARDVHLNVHADNRQKQYVHWINGNLVSATLFDFSHIDSGNHLTIEPGDTFPLVARISLAPGQYEAHVHARWRIGQNPQVATVAWFPLDVVEQPVVKAAGRQQLKQGKSPDMGLEVVDVEYLPPDDLVEWSYLSFTLRSAPGTKRRIAVAMSGWGVEPSLAGVLSVMDAAGHRLKVEVQHRVGNDLPFRMMPLTRQGIPTTIGFKRYGGGKLDTPVDRIKLEILTDRGLAAVWLSP
ncbi:MAG: hypothetical protein WD847_21075 [Pirellulales bacterium]